jgi:uncharacterized protein (TIGR02594 family)
MARIPDRYLWLEKEPGPKMLREALALCGTVEAPGAKDNKTILGWAKETGLDNVYTHDETPWCGLFMAVVALRAGKRVPKDPLWALSWRAFGTKVDTPMLGDVLVFTRSGGGHVALYVGEDDSAWHCLGGNQSDAVSFSRVPKTRTHWVRRPSYNIQPNSVRVIRLKNTGTPYATES